MVLAALLLLGVNANAVTIDTVVIGDPGNAPDFNGYGSVGYSYRMSTYEVTNSQYVEFLNAKASVSDPFGLYNLSMATQPYAGIVRSGSPGNFSYAIKTNMGNKPVNYVSAHDAMRFANWLQNGQGSGSTETGAYDFTGGNVSTITRTANAQWFLPTASEWYKAAYYQPASAGGDADNYWTYATRSNSPPTVAFIVSPAADIANPGPNVVNYNDGVGIPTSVGTAGPQSASYYGTYDQTGNIAEVTESFFLLPTQVGGSRVNFPGYFGSNLTRLPAGVQVEQFATLDSFNDGFRLAAVIGVPEPSTIGMAVVGLIALAGVALRHARHRAILR